MDGYLRRHSQISEAYISIHPRLLSKQPTDPPNTTTRQPVSNHDELMSNFFAQPDALACGKTLEELDIEGVKVRWLAFLGP